MARFAKETPLSWFTAILGSSGLLAGGVVGALMLSPPPSLNAKLMHPELETEHGAATADQHNSYGKIPKAEHVSHADSRPHGTYPEKHETTQPKKKHKKLAAKSHGTKAHWGYQGRHGPAHWDELNPNWEMCREGRQQSPIDISYQTGASDQDPINVSYLAGDLRLHNNGHTIQGDVQEGSFIQVSGKRYHLLQFHFHTPSEHTVEGHDKPAEMHLVHRAKDGELAILGAMIDHGIENELFSRLWEYMPMSKGHKHDFSIVDLQQVLPESMAYYSYSGSLTTPPCSEGVRWMVLKEPIQASRQQLTYLRKVIGPTARPVQILHGRTPLVRGMSPADMLAH